jgi:hypothetical protein
MSQSGLPLGLPMLASASPDPPTPISFQFEESVINQLEILKVKDLGDCLDICSSRLIFLRGSSADNRLGIWLHVFNLYLIILRRKEP